MFLLCSHVDRSIPHAGGRHPYRGTICNARDLIERFKAVDVINVAWIDPVRGQQMLPIGEARSANPRMMTFRVPREFEVAVIMAAKRALDDADERAALDILSEMADTEH
jgi:hypothetical protein